MYFCCCCQNCCFQQKWNGKIKQFIDFISVSSTLTSIASACDILRNQLGFIAFFSISNQFSITFWRILVNCYLTYQSSLSIWIILNGFVVVVVMEHKVDWCVRQKLIDRFLYCLITIDWISCHKQIDVIPSFRWMNPFMRPIKKKNWTRKYMGRREGAWKGVLCPLELLRFDPCQFRLLRAANKIGSLKMFCCTAQQVVQNSVIFGIVYMAHAPHVHIAIN